jgi:hypothetical protein
VLLLHSRRDWHAGPRDQAGGSHQVCVMHIRRGYRSAHMIVIVGQRSALATLGATGYNSPSQKAGRLRQVSAGPRRVNRGPQTPTQRVRRGQARDRGA